MTAFASASTAGSNPITTYLFDFGDGTGAVPQATSQATHIYTVGGTFLVRVTVTDSAGFSSSATEQLTVGAPVAKLAVSPAFGPVPLAVTADGFIFIT